MSARSTDLPGALAELVTSWLAGVMPTILPETVERRRAAVRSLVQDDFVSDDRHVLDLVALAFGFKPENGDAELAIAGACSSSDPRFALERADEEVGVIGAAVLLELGRVGDRSGLVAMLGVECAAAKGMRNGRRVEPLTETLRQIRRMHAIAEANRVDGSLSLASSAGSDPTQNAERIDELRESLSYAREELDVAWIVISEFSPSIDAPYSTLPAAAAPLVIGADLARATKRPLGIPSAAAVASRLCKHVKRLPEKSTVGGYTERLPSSWCDRLLQETEVGGAAAIFPILSALKLRQEAPEKWKVAYEALTGLDSDREIAPQAAALQLCDEMLLSRLLGEAEE